MIRIEVEGEKAALDVINTATHQFIDEMEENVAFLVSDIHTKATTRVPVDLGFLKNSLYQESQGLNGEVGAKMHYSPYVEFGTGTEVDVPSGLEDYALQFKGEGKKQVNIPARPYLFNSAFEEVKTLIDKLRKDGVISSG